MPRRPMPLRPHAIARTRSSSGAFRSAPALRWRWRRSSRIGRLILEAPYTSIADVAASAFWFAPVRLLMRDQFRSDERIARVKVPLLVMHGALDPTIPVAFGERLFALANEPKRFVRLARGGHNDLDNFGAIEIARNFINLAKG